jgi:hypothetical protein
MNIPQQTNIFFDEAKAINGGIVQPVYHSLQKYKFYAFQFYPTSLGDEIQSIFTLDKGVYDFYVLGIATVVSPVVNWLVDKESIGNQNWFNQSPPVVFNLVKKIENVIIKTSGNHFLNRKVVAKNTLATYPTPYYLYHTKAWFIRK